MKHRSAAKSKRLVPLSLRCPSADGCFSLTELMRRRLVQVDEATNATWAERLIEMWIFEALKGNFRAFQEILNRIDGDGFADTQASEDRAHLHAETAAKVLEALCDATDSLPND